MQKIEPHSEQATSGSVVAENIEALRALFPEAFGEGGIKFDVLKQLLGGPFDEGEERYGLNWSGKKRARQLALTPSLGTLRPCPGESVDWETTKNIVIEGDNLEVLKLLRKSYAGKVKLIYIDPPYNTGNDFVYPDDFADGVGNYLRITGQVGEDGGKISSNTESSGRFHTNWLNMMYPRLKLAKELLTEDGLLFVSLDDAEIADLMLILGDTFGQENIVANMIWEKGRKNDAKLISVGHEYLVVVARSKAVLKERGVIWREEKPGAREIWDKYVELRAEHKTDSAVEIHLKDWFKQLPKKHPSKKWARYSRVDKHGPWRDRDISWPGGGGPRYDVVHPRTGQPCQVPERGWIYSRPEEMQRRIQLGLVAFRDDHTDPPFQKAHIRPVADDISDEGDLPDFDDIEAQQNDSDPDGFANQVRGSYFYKQSQISVKELRSLMGAKVFTNPKDREELARLFTYTTPSQTDYIVLDFFAGSGTTGHAVLAQNAADNGNRRYICVQLPEPLDPADKNQKTAADFCDKLGKPRTIAELTKERLRRAGAKIKADNPLFHGDTGFRVFKLDTSNLKPWDPRPDDIHDALTDWIENIRPGRTEDDLLFELLLKLGLDLCVPIEQRSIAGKTVHNIGAGTLMVCLDTSISRADAEPLGLGLVQWAKQLAPAGGTQFVFRDSAFADDVAKTNLDAILRQNLTDGALAAVRSL